MDPTKENSNAVLTITFLAAFILITIAFVKFLSDIASGAVLNLIEYAALGAPAGGMFGWCLKVLDDRRHAAESRKHSTRVELAKLNRPAAESAARLAVELKKYDQEIAFVLSERLPQMRDLLEIKNMHSFKVEVEALHGDLAGLGSIKLSADDLGRLAAVDDFQDGIDQYNLVVERLKFRALALKGRAVEILQSDFQLQFIKWNYNDVEFAVELLETTRQTLRQMIAAVQNAARIEEAE